MEFVSQKPMPDEVVMDYSMLGGAHAERGRKLFLTGLLLLAVALLYLAYNANVDEIEHLVLGLSMFALSILPSLMWARSGGSRFPVFETMLLLCANFYAMPMLNAQEQLAAYSAAIISRSGLAVILYQCTAIIVYISIKGVPGRSPFWRESMITRDVERYIVYGLILSTVFVWMSTFTDWIPADALSVLRAVFYGVGILCTFVSTQQWGRGDLDRAGKTILVCTLVPQIIMMSVGLLLIGSISLIGIGILGYLAGGKRVPWLVIGVAFLILAVLHTGKTRMRDKYWDTGVPAPTFSQLPEYFTEWIDYGLQPTSGDKSVSQKILERSSLMHMLCLIVEYSPERQDYLYGKTYAHVLPQLIPRLFWPEKPRATIATTELSLYYGLQDEETAAKTSIAFGLLTEAYANFGLLGGILLGAFWGFWLKKLQIWSTFSPMFSFAGLFMVLLTAWSFNAEMTMATWASSLEQAAFVVLGIPMLLRSLFGL